MGPNKNTGIIVKENSFAISQAEPGARLYIRAIKAIWSSLSPNWDITWLSQSRKKFLFLNISVNFATARL